VTTPPDRYARNFMGSLDVLLLLRNDCLQAGNKHVAQASSRKDSRRKRRDLCQNAL
jgi:hypothetical protein